MDDQDAVIPVWEHCNAPSKHIKRIVTLLLFCDNHKGEIQSLLPCHREMILFVFGPWFDLSR